MDRKSTVYVTSVTGVAIAFSLAFLPLADLADFTRSDWVGLVAFILIGVLAQAAAIDFGAGRQATSSLAFIPLLATAIVFPPGAALVAAVTVIGFSEVVTRRAPLKAAFNISQLVLALGLSALAYASFSGPDRAGITIIGTIALVTVFFTVNIVLSSIGLAFYRSQPIVPTFKDVIGPRGGNLLYDVLSSPFVVIFVVQYLYIGVVGVIVVILPILLVRHSYAGRQKLAHANRDLLVALIKAIETRDPYTSGHSIRVATLSTLIAEDLGLSPRRVDRVRRAALLHDVGKIDPAYSAVILKPHDLTGEERALIQTHAAKGADLLRDMGSMEREIVAAVRHHHERYDGQGYPDGMAGTDIPFESRIIMMSDSIDAMLSDRPYRAALTIEKVKAELEDCAGKQFDPSIVRAVLKHKTLERAVSLVEEWQRDQAMSDQMLSRL
jgi:putative nucleotidyltransferase with HDIG domain